MADLEFELEETVPRAEIAARLKAIAAAFEGDDDEVEMTLGAGKVKLPAPPETVRMELEVEVDGDETELELELKWDRVPEAPGSASGAAGDPPANATTPDAS